MLKPGPALKVAVHLNEDTSAQERFLHQDVLAYLQKHGIEGATVFRPHAGYGVHRKLHTHGAGPVTGEHLPVLVLFIDAEAKVRAILPGLLAMVNDGLVEMHSVEVLKHVVLQAH